MNYYFKALKGIFNLKGKATRKEFWTFFLANIIVTMIAYLIMIFFEMDTQFISIWNAIIGLSFVLIGIRRFHDLGKSGWNILWGLIPVIGIFVILFAFMDNGRLEENNIELNV